jgi:hypothetical protein
MNLRKTILRTNIYDKETGTDNKSEVTVLDDYLKLKQMHHKITKGMTEEICFWAQNQGSYESAQEVMRNRLGINVSDEYIRTITMEVGQLVLNDDTEKAENIDHINAEIPVKPTIDGVLYTNKKRLCRI